MADTPKIRANDPSPRTLRYLLAAGHASLVGMLLLFVFLYLHWGAPYDATWQLVLAQILGGRAGSVHLGIDAGFNRYYLIFQISMHDFILMFYLYPLFVMGYQRLSQVRFIGGYLVRLNELAEQHKQRVAPYGIAGLLVFVCFPFWNIGPLLGMIVGYLLGLHLWLVLPTVIVGNVAAVSGWLWAYEKLRGYSRGLALALLILAFILMALIALYARARLRRQQKAREQDAAAAPDPDQAP